MYSIANLYFVFRYGGELYLQTDGLAIGVVSSPHIANLYTTKYEQYMLKDPNVLLYKRYIDNIFTIIIALTKEDTLIYAKETLLFPELNLKWEVEQYRIEFLNLKVMHVPSTSQCDFHPHR